MRRRSSCPHCRGSFADRAPGRFLLPKCCRRSPAAPWRPPPSCRLLASASFDTASTRCWASARPIFCASAITRLSDSASPSVTSRFCRMRAGSISSPSTTSRNFSRLPAERSKSSRIVSHSAAQAPAARSCSCSKPKVIVAIMPDTRRWLARIAIEPTGLRLCGMEDEPPLPATAGSKASPTSVCMRSRMSVAIFVPRREGRRARAAMSNTRLALAHAK